MLSVSHNTSMNLCIFREYFRNIFDTFAFLYLINIGILKTRIITIKTKLLMVSFYQLLMFFNTNFPFN